MQAINVVESHKKAVWAFEADTVQRLTKEGFRVETLPEPLWALIRNEYKK